MLERGSPPNWPMRGVGHDMDRSDSSRSDPLGGNVPAEFGVPPAVPYTAIVAKNCAVARNEKGGRSRPFALWLSPAQLARRFRKPNKPSSPVPNKASAAGSGAAGGSIA